MESKPIGKIGDKRKYGPIALTALRAALCLAFVGAGIFKRSGHPVAVAEFHQVGLGRWLRFVTAVTEITGAVLLVIPRTIMVGAGLLTALCVAAFFAQRLALHGDVIHNLVLAILGAIAWRESRRPFLQR